MTDGQRLQGWREFRGLSRRELAAQIGVSRQTVTAWETGQWLPSDEHLPRIAEVLGVPTPSPAPIFPDPPRMRRAS